MNLLISHSGHRRSTGIFKRALQTSVLLSAIAGSLGAANNYFVHNLVSDLPNTADHQDPNLVNAWGVAASSTGPFWVGNNHTATSTIYDTSGTPSSLVVTVPTPSQTTGGAVTGVLFNGGAQFTVATGAPSVFLFCTEDGTISGWNTSVDQTHAKIVVDNSATGAIYKGCALGGTTDAPQLYAANFHAGTVEVWDGAFHAATLAAGSFTDPHVPAGYAPFNIQNLAGKLYVTYAKQSDDKEEDVAGVGNGYVSVFDMSGTLLTHLIAQGPLNSPWGVAIAPTGFGDFGGALLVGNFGDGLINAFDATTGALKGTLNDTNGTPIKIDGLWALLFGNGSRGGDLTTLYFTAGPAGPNGEPVESHGMFGSVQAAPVLTTTSITNAASFSDTLAPNSWGTIFAGSLSATTRSWEASDFVNNQIPASLSGVAVTVNGEPAYLSYISPTQINFLIPSDITPGPVQIAATNNGLASAPVPATLLPAAPAFFFLSGTKYIAATHVDGSLTGPTGLVSGLTTTPVVPGETVVLYGSGFGPTSPAVTNGQVVTTALNLATLPTLTIGGLPATISFAGLSATGLYQINAVVPAIPPGATPEVDAVVVAEALGMQSQANTFISVAPPAAEAGTSIEIVNFAFKPTPVTVAAGSKVTWTNKDGVQHTVVADDNQFASSGLDTNATYSQTLTAPGTYNYHCSIHPSMKATVVVQ